MPTSSGRVAEAADQRLVGGQVEPLDAAAGARHQRIVLEAQAGADREVGVHVPAIAHVDRALPLASGHLLGLDVLALIGLQAEQERAELVPQQRRVARHAGDGAVEAEPAADAADVAELGLDVVQRVTDDVDADAQVVAREDLRQRGAERVAALLAEQRHPVRRRADVVAGVVDCWCRSRRRAGRSRDVGAVRAGDAEVEAEVVAEVRARSPAGSGCWRRSCRRARGSGPASRCGPGRRRRRACRRGCRRRSRARSCRSLPRPASRTCPTPSATRCAARSS